jgi:prefoldin subunit 5
VIAGNARRITELNFRSQYMRTKLARLLKRVTLTARQAERFQSAMERRQR